MTSYDVPLGQAVPAAAATLVAGALGGAGVAAIPSRPVVGVAILSLAVTLQVVNAIVTYTVLYRFQGGTHA